MLTITIIVFHKVDNAIIQSWMTYVCIHVHAMVDMAWHGTQYLDITELSIYWKKSKITLCRIDTFPCCIYPTSDFFSIEYNNQITTCPNIIQLAVEQNIHSNETLAIWLVNVPDLCTLNPR
jgi:hypothetical protein